MILALTALFWFASRNLIASGWGTAVLSYRDHPYASVANGVNPMRVRAALYVLSGIPCGVAGALFANSQQFISASNFGTQTVLLFLGSVLLGGRGTNWGPVFGVTIFAGISLWLGPFSLYNPLILAVGVLVAALTFKGGIIGALERAWRRYGRSRGVGVRLLDTDLDSKTSIAPIENRPHVEIRGVTKHFAGNYALRDVGLSVPGGSVVTVVGPNGSGKTTLLNCVSGFVKPDSGEVTLDGRNLVGLKNHRRAHIGLARTFQVPRLVEELTVRENAELGVWGLNPQSVGGAIFRTPAFRRRQRVAAERAIAACRELGLGERATQVRVEELPLAVKRLVEIARALAASASVICLDEPVAGLNEAEQERVANVLRDVAASGRAVLLIEHNLPFVLNVSDQLVLLRDGQVVDHGVPVDVKDRTRPLGEYFHTFAAKTDHIDRLEARI
jgi:ABC-type branched-subunit amino acid transport system ATPase component